MGRDDRGDGSAATGAGARADRGHGDVSQPPPTVPTMPATGAIAYERFARPVRIAVLSTALIPRLGVAALVDQHDHLEVVYQGDPDDREHLADVRADIYIVGVWINAGAGARAIQDLAAAGACVLALLGTGVTPVTALELGAHAVADGHDPDGSVVMAAIERCIRGEHDPVPEDVPHDHIAISPREREVLAELAKGRTDQEIAVTLGISVRTVQSHLDRIREKTRRRRRAELTVLAVELGIVGDNSR